ncbi:LexA family protein [Sphingobium sp. DEHP117]|uniref:LexA family protein n=1 Tax=Sphingobium sp. DEHP117 TaxID=2993436 RepID=UPI0035A021AA
MDGGYRGFYLLRDGTGSTEGVENKSCFCLHTDNNAIFATSFQGENCDNGNGIFRRRCFDGGMTQDEIRALIRAQKAAGKIKFNAMAKLCGMPDPTYFSKSMSGKRDFTLEEMDILLRFFGYDVVKRDDRLRLLPVVGLVSAGQWRDGFEHVREHVVSPDQTVGKNAFIVIVDGDSMDKVAPDGSYAIVDPDDKRLSTKRMYVVRNGGGETTFKCYKDDPARLEPLSSNLEHKTIYPGEEGFEVVGRVVMTMQVNKH